MSDYDGLHEAEKQRKENASQKREEQLKQLCDKVESYWGGFIINDKFIVGKYKNRWRVKGKGKWYYFKSISDFVKKYVNE